MREIVHIQAGQCGNQIGAKVSTFCFLICFNYFFFDSDAHRPPLCHAMRPAGRYLRKQYN